MSLSWQDVDAAVSHVAGVAARHGIVEVLGIMRGGAIPAVMLSHRLGVPVTLARRPAALNRGTVLLVDDIIDTGVTVQRAMTENRDCVVAAIVSRCATIDDGDDRPRPVTSYRRVPYGCNWVVFPWELPG